jgi:sulfatase modifying factor 1
MNCAEGMTMRIVPLQLLASVAIAMAVNGCGDQHEAKAEPVDRMAHVWKIAQPAWAATVGQDQWGIWADLVVHGVTQRLRFIKPGSFAMGSPADEAGRCDNETLHGVALTHGYWLADSSCTQALWQAVMGSNPSLFLGDPLRPVETVSWDDCQGFLGKVVGSSPGAQARLPTEAEWEYACRAGTTALYNGSSLDALGWYYGNSGNTTHPVKQKTPNAWGLFDMHGNVWQWCSDRYGDYPSGTLTDPAGPASGPNRVRRGGSWDNVPAVCRSANRDGRAPGYSGSYLGFRLCISDQTDRSP